MPEFNTPDFAVLHFRGLENPNEMTVALTMALEATNQGHTAAIVMMVDGVHTALENGPLAKPLFDIGAPFKPCKELYDAFIGAGGRILICKACFIHNHLDEKDLIPGCSFIGAPEVVRITMESKTLQLT